MREFVIGDLHGAYRAVKQCLEAVNFDYKKDRLIQLGDVVDRNPEVFECVEESLKLKHLIVVRGNHDDWFDEFCQTGRHPVEWLQGGKATARSNWNYSQGKSGRSLSDYELIKKLTPEHIPESHRAFFKQLQLYYIGRHGRCFVHASFNRFFPFTTQHLSTYYWDRDLWRAAVEWQRSQHIYNRRAPFEIKTAFKEIYIGHSPTTYWDSITQMRCANLTNLDTDAGQGGKLSIVDLKSKEFWQSEPVSKFRPGILEGPNSRQS
jgi:serine/threonine protein phosphatase 1